MRLLLATPLGFLIGVSLGALGGGGAILAVPVLVYVAGETARGATTTSLIVVGAAALVGMAAHWRAGRVRAGTGLAFGLAGTGGSLAGTTLNRHLDPNVLLLVFSGLVVVAAWRMVVGCPSCTRVGEERQLAAGSPGGPAVGTRAAAPALAAKVVAAGTGVGLLTGLFGVGGGFVIVPALTLLLGMAMPQAIGTSLLVVALNSAAALAFRLASSSVHWALALGFSASAVLGVLAGKALADRLDAEQSLKWFAALLVGVALYTATRAGLGLAGA
ncbi:MAG TPA: sulfite exporter TauE/SafE family protein [Acidimicrobiales bacterium]|nr:sulfite exporter TauE/SafE family protein [Acidimicrobiales bacterium]